MSASDFPRFPDLPTELRLKIWSFCVPGPRVYEMDTASAGHHTAFPAGAALFSPLSGRVPVISLVCREAREVALKRNQYVTLLPTGEAAHDGAGYPAWTHGNANLPARFRKGVDVVHLHWHRGYDLDDWLAAAPYPLPSFQWLANRAAAASVSADLLHPFDLERDDPWSPTTTIGYEDIQYFSPHVLYYVVLAVVEIHISDDEVARAGVFGALGEEPVQLVDPRDTATVGKFRDAWGRRQSPLPEPDVAGFFRRATDEADAYRARVEQYASDLEKVWLWNKCFELGVSEEARAEIWPSPRLNWSRRALDREHPWVRTQLALMPRFEPALMFRHCSLRCGTPRSSNP